MLATTHGVPETAQPVEATQPALDHAALLNEVLFGQTEGADAPKRMMRSGDTRAYPARFPDWHEMFNGIAGGEPVSLVSWFGWFSFYPRTGVYGVE